MRTEKQDFRSFEIRAMPQTEEKPSYIVEGYAAVFNQQTCLYECGGIRYLECIASGAFDSADMSDVVLRFNHDGKPAARTTNNTLTLTVDTVGLHIRADLGGTAAGRQLYEEIVGGYITQMSFAFTVDTELYNKTQNLRTITAFKRIFDVSAVDFPAYDGTSISARSRGIAMAERVRQDNERQKLLLKLKLF